MPEADDVLVLTVPETVRAVYLVPTSEPPSDPVALLKAHARGRWQGELGDLMAKILSRPVAPVEIREAGDIPELPVELLSVMGATEEQLDRVTSATHFVLSMVQSQAGWPPVHEWVTRAIATAMADALHSDVIDVLNYHVLDVERANATLPDEDSRIRLADWVWVDYSPDSTGYWCTTTGLRRFGLPELQTLATPPSLVESWGQAMTGVAHRLLGTWSARLADDRTVAFVQFPSTMEFGVRDVATAYGRDDLPIGASDERVTVRLELDPASDPDNHSFLTIQPPLSWSGSAGEHIAEACAALFGGRAVSVRRTTPSALMDQAIETARASLDEIRARFESGLLDVRQRLLVKYALPSAEGTEYVWAYVTSWRDPARILAASAGDAIYQPRIRAGRPVVIDTESVVDWALEDDEFGIIEGGWTQAALDETP